MRNSSNSSRTRTAVPKTADRKEKTATGSRARTEVPKTANRREKAATDSRARTGVPKTADRKAGKAPAPGRTRTVHPSLLRIKTER